MEGMAIFGIKYDRNVWKNTVLARIQEYGRRQWKNGFGIHQREQQYVHMKAPNGYSLLVVGVPQCHSRGDCSGEHCKLYPPTPPLRRPGLPVFWGSQPCVPAAWLAERLLLAGDIESNPGPRPTLKTPTHTQPPTFTKFILDLWMSPERVAPLLVRWKRRLAGLL